MKFRVCQTRGGDCLLWLRVLGCVRWVVVHHQLHTSTEHRSGWIHAVRIKYVSYTTCTCTQVFMDTWPPLMSRPRDATSVAIITFESFDMNDRSAMSRSLWSCATLDVCCPFSSWDRSHPKAMLKSGIDPIEKHHHSESNSHLPCATLGEFLRWKLG